MSSPDPQRLGSKGQRREEVALASSGRIVGQPIDLGENAAQHLRIADLFVQLPEVLVVLGKDFLDPHLVGAGLEKHLACGGDDLSTTLLDVGHEITRRLEAIAYRFAEDFRPMEGHLLQVVSRDQLLVAELEGDLWREALIEFHQDCGRLGRNAELARRQRAERPVRTYCGDQHGIRAGRRKVPIEKDTVVAVQLTPLGSFTDNRFVAVGEAPGLWNTPGRPWILQSMQVVHHLRDDRCERRGMGQLAVELELEQHQRRVQVDVVGGVVVQPQMPSPRRLDVLFGFRLPESVQHHAESLVHAACRPVPFAIVI